MPPSQAIVEAIAARDGVDVTDVVPPAYEPLHAVVDPEALDALFRPIASGAPASRNAVDTRVVLEYEGSEVTVYSDGNVELSDPSTGDESTGDPIGE